MLKWARPTGWRAAAQLSDGGGRLSHGAVDACCCLQALPAFVHHGLALVLERRAHRLQLRQPVPRAKISLGARPPASLLSVVHSAKSW